MSALGQALRSDSCTFPSYTLTLHRVVAAHMEQQDEKIAALEDQLAAAEAENHQAWNILHALFAVLPATSEEYHIIKEFIEGTWRQE